MELDWNRFEQIAQVLENVARRREQGQDVPDAEVIRAHSHLMPELAEELESLRQVRQAAALARGGQSLRPEANGSAGPSFSTTLDFSMPTLEPEGDTHPRMPRGYLAVHRVGQGGQGSVFRAIQESTGKTVAVKLLEGGAFVSSRNRARFDREAAILSSIDHPNIVSIIDRGRLADGSFYIVMQFVDGVSIEHHLANATLEQILSVFARVCYALDVVHRKGIVHRDLKPSNILIDERGEPHILDFGLARLMENTSLAVGYRTLTESGQIVGSIPWASPEQVDGRHRAIDNRSDLHAIGLMMYKVIAGTFPYRVGGAITETVKQITTAQPPGLMGLKCRTKVTRDVDAMVLKALAKSPAERYQTAREFAEEIETCLRGGRTRARKARLWIRSGLAAAVGMVILAAVAIGVQTRRPELTPQPLELPKIVNSVGMTLVKVPLGSVTLGSRPSELGRYDNETETQFGLTEPIHFAAHEVTRAQFAQVMGRPEVMSEGDDTLPMTNVSWDDAVAFCEKLSTLEGRQYRLPTTEEWEYACRAQQSHPFGGQSNPGAIAWYIENSGGHLHPVGTRLPNLWGLFDMHGNASEWCADEYVSQVVRRPPAGGISTGVRHVIRGGDAISARSRIRSAFRSDGATDLRSPFVGFRVVLVSP